MTTTAHDPRELVLVRTFDAPPELVYRAWTEPERIKPWFCPKPWYVSHAETDVRAGGSSYVVMNGPNGEVHHNRGVYLEVVPNRKLVFTDADTHAKMGFTEGWNAASDQLLTLLAQWQTPV